MTYTFTDTPKPPPEDSDGRVPQEPDAGLPIDPKDPFPNDESADPGIPVTDPSPDTTESPS